MAAQEDVRTDRCTFCGAAALALCALHVLAIFVFCYRHLPADLRAVHFSPPNDGLKMFLVNYGTFLSPVIIVLLSRRLPIVLGLCAIPILVNLSAQLYYEWLFLTTGTNPSMRQKGDWASWFPTFFGVLSVAVAAVWLFWFAAGGLAARLIRR
jgi:hypothetical protein